MMVSLIMYMKNQKKSIKIFVAFLVACFVLGTCIGINSTIYAVKNHLEDFDLPFQTKLVVGIASLIICCPWLLICNYYAKIEKVKAIQVLSIVLFLFISVCILCTIIPMLFT